MSDFIDFLERMNITANDRVILNGGEPFLHTQIIDLLRYLKHIDCEVLIYTNATLVSNHKLDFLTSKFRFVIPIHGFAELHDKITCRKGSFDAMKQGIRHLHQCDCLIDLKFILNDSMLSSDAIFDKTIASVDYLAFNNAIHVTKMADTIRAKINNCHPVTMERASKYTAKIFNHFKDRVSVIKLFDTCINSIEVDNCIIKYSSFSVYFKDCQHERQIPLKESVLDCRQYCKKSENCFSAVGTYTTLEYCNGQFYKNLE